MNANNANWRTDAAGGFPLDIHDQNGKLVARVMHDASRECAERIVSCVNALAGLPQECLDGGWTGTGLSAHAKRMELRVAELEQIMSEPLKRLVNERDQLRSVCAEAYQLAAALNAPVEALDNLSAAANGEQLPHATLLPVTAVGDVVSQRDELLAALEMVMRRGRIDDSEEAMNQVAAAIAKAKGGEA